MTNIIMAAVDNLTEVLDEEDPTTSTNTNDNAAQQSSGAAAPNNSGHAVAQETESNLGIGVGGKINDIYSAAKHLAAMKPLPLGQASALDDITEAEADEAEAHQLALERKQQQEQLLAAAEQQKSAVNASNNVSPTDGTPTGKPVRNSVDQNGTAGDMGAGGYGTEEKLTRAEIALREAQRNFEQYLTRMDDSATSSNNKKTLMTRGPISFLSQLRFEVEDEFTFFSDSERDNDEDDGIAYGLGESDQEAADEKLQQQQQQQQTAKVVTDDEADDDELQEKQQQPQTPLPPGQLTEVRDFRRQLKQALKAPGEHEMLKVFAQLDFNDLKRQQAIRVRDQASQYRLRRVFAEDNAWTLNNVSTLTSRCLEVLARKFADEPDLYRALNYCDQQQMLSLLPNAKNLPLATTFRFIEDEKYWHESCANRWHEQNIFKHSDQYDTYKCMYAELNLRDRIERYVPGLAGAATDASLQADIQATQSYIKRLNIRQMMPPVRPAFGEVADRLATQILRRIAIKPNTAEAAAIDGHNFVAADGHADGGRTTLNTARSTMAENEDLAAEIDRLTGMDKVNHQLINDVQKSSNTKTGPRNPFLYQVDSQSFQGVKPETLNIVAGGGAVEEVPLAKRIGLVTLKPDGYLKLPRFKEEQKPQQILYQQLLKKFRAANDQLLTNPPLSAAQTTPPPVTDFKVKPTAEAMSKINMVSHGAPQPPAATGAHFTMDADGHLQQQHGDDTETRDHYDLNHVLPFLTRLRELELTYSVRECGMNFEWRFLRATIGDCMKLGTAIMKCTQLKRLCLHKSRLDDEQAGIVFQSVSRHPTLQVLEMPNNCISDTACVLALKYLPQLKTLRKLDLSNNLIRRAGGRALASLVVKCRNLRTLVLPSNNIGDDGANPIFEVIVKKDTNLRELDLTGNGLLDACMSALAQVLSQNKKLEILRVAANNFKEEGSAKLLQEGLSRNKTICVLDVRGCDMSAELQAYVEELTSRNRDYRRQMIVSKFIGSQQQQQDLGLMRGGTDNEVRLPTELDNDFQTTFHHAYPPVQSAEEIAAATAAVESASKAAAALAKAQAAATEAAALLAAKNAAANHSKQQTQFSSDRHQKLKRNESLKSNTAMSSTPTTTGSSGSKSRSASKTASEISKKLPRKTVRK